MRNTMKNLTLVAAGLCVVLGAASCKTKPKDEYAGIDGDYVSGVPLPERTDGAAYLGGNVSKGQFPPVQFGFDSFEVSGSEMGKVQAVADFMRSGKGDIIIAGFTDERGTEEYNRGLGERRALAVREALIGKGISGGRVQTVSFGEEMPVSSGGGEAAWAANRRAEFGVIR
jgi:peptidoglycan-associated lipoprotein